MIYVSRHGGFQPLITWDDSGLSGSIALGCFKELFLPSLLFSFSKKIKKLLWGEGVDERRGELIL